MKLETLFQFGKIEANNLVNNIILLEITHRPLELNVNDIRESSATVYIPINCYCINLEWNKRLQCIQMKNHSSFSREAQQSRGDIINTKHWSKPHYFKLHYSTSDTTFYQMVKKWKRKPAPKEKEDIIRSFSTCVQNESLTTRGKYWVQVKRAFQPPQQQFYYTMAPELRVSFIPYQNLCSVRSWMTKTELVPCS